MDKVQMEWNTCGIKELESLISLEVEQTRAEKKRN
jgi:hypothetical protein